MSKKSIIVALLAVAVLMATLWFGMRLGERKSAQVATGKPDIAQNVPQALPAAVMPQINQVPPPWATPNAASGANVIGTQTDRQKNLAELKEMQMALARSVQENHKADPKQVIALLDKLKQVSGSSVVAGVNIDGLRNTLIAADEAQRVALEMSAEAKKPGGPDPVKMKAYTQRLQQLQSQLVMSQPAFQGAPK